MRRESSAGLTLLELLFVLAILGLLTSAGLPRLHGVMDSHRLATTAATLRGHLHYARAEAVRRGHDVVLCGSKDCGTTDWSAGWRVFAAGEGNETPLEHGEPAAPDVRTNRRRLAFRFDGTTRAGGTLTVCGNSGRGRQLVVSRSGRVRGRTATDAACAKD
ncbi:MAG: GspH/FimT family pseudopilin [Pseudomonadota bacterium]